jgi:peroxiredoxin family protein
MSEDTKKKRLLIICSKGTLDMAFPPFMLATTAKAMDWDVHLYFTFWGMDIVTKGKSENLMISPLGNPSMPLPNIVGAIPGMTLMATTMMKNQMKKSNMPELQDLIKMAKEMGVKFHACTSTMELNGVTENDLIPEVDDMIGAATYLSLAEDADVQLFV